MTTNFKNNDKERKIVKLPYISLKPKPKEHPDRNWEEATRLHLHKNK